MADTVTNTADRYEGHTPLMRQYLQMKDENPGTLLLYRLGDFYETFFDDARRLNQLLGLTLTSRGTYQGEPIPMAGVPASTLDQYLVRLVRLGESVAISEQVGDPSKVKAGAMMERKIVRIVTPGTLTDAALLPEHSDSVLLAVTFSRLASAPAGVVWLTLTNGRFRAMKVAAGDLPSLLARIHPSEILASDSARVRLAELSPNTTVTELPDWHFDAERGEEQLKHRFALANLDSWMLTHETELLASINALLGYVEQTQREALPHIEPLVIESDSEFISLDAATRRNLEITETLRADNGPTLASVIDHTATSMGARMLRQWLHHPLRDVSRVRKRHQAVRFFVEHPESLADTVELLRFIPDIERMAGRIALRSLRPKDAAALRDTLPRIACLAETLQTFETDLFRDGFFTEKTAALSIDAALFRRLNETLLEEPSTFLRDGDVIRSEFCSELAELRALRDNAGEFLRELELREKERTGIATLRVEYNKVSGFYIEVSRAQAANVPEDYRRRQTLKNTERFITPELKQFEDRAISAKDRAQALERELWETLLTDLAVYVEAILCAARAIAEIDTVASFARHAFEARWCEPVFKETPGLKIIAARHPVVEHMLEHYVPNDCHFHEKRRLLVITGPNMGGKSTYMRSIALVTLLAYAGSFVPATSAEIGPVDKILTRIGASDDLARGRSTFMVEMTEAATILNQATDRSLVLMDEIGRGTSTFDGLSLAAAIATDLATKSKSWTLFATHYFELTELAQTLKNVVNVHVCAEQTAKSVVFLHDIKEGPASQSFGIAVASLAGVPGRVISRARKFMQELENRTLGNGPQMDLFAMGEESPAPEPVKSESDTERDAFIRDLAQLDVDTLTPREALNLLYQLKETSEKIV